MGEAGETPDATTWWFDRCLGNALPEAIAALGVRVKRYIETFPDDPTVDDVEWIPKITSLGWVIVTKDKNIRKDAVEREVLIAARARYVCLASAKLNGEKQIETMTRHWGTIDSVIRTRKAPILVNVTVPSVSWLDGDAWREAKHKRLRLPK